MPSSGLSSTHRPRSTGESEKVKTNVKNPALGPYEAACLLGCHWTRVSRMADKGELRSRQLRSHRGSKRLRIYSLTDIESNWTDYQYLLRTGQLPRRPRANEHLRPGMLSEIRKMENHIEFDDAVGSVEAAEILGVWHTWLRALLSKGAICGRRLISHREGASRTMIYSRKSCEENIQAARKMASSGATPGRPRHAL